MNAQRLKEILDLLLENESKHRIQKMFSQVNSHLSNLVSAPTNAEHQTNYSNSFKQFEVAVTAMDEAFSPAQKNLFREIGASRWFSRQIIIDVEKLIQANPITPSVAHQGVGALHSERSKYLQEITSLRDNLQSIGIHSSLPPKGEAEIGILLPRTLFENDLEHLVKELNTVRLIIMAFSELSNGGAESIQVKQISTSDPIFFFGVSLATIAAIGKAVTWSLDTWKKVEDIKKIRNEARKISALSDDDVSKFFTEKIKKTLADETEKKAKELITGREKEGRANELEKYIHWALEALIARVERGMTIEIRMLPPAAEQKAQVGTAEFATATTIQQIIPQLMFPAAKGEPVAALPPPEPQLIQKSEKAKKSDEKK